MKDLVRYSSIGLLLLFAYFQWNDPDPFRWVVIYLFAAYTVFQGAKNQSFSKGLALGFLVAAVLQWPPVFEGFIFGEMAMRSMNIELAREAGGLAIAAALIWANART